MRAYRFAAAASVFALAGCANHPQPRVNAPPHGVQERPHPMAELYTQMTDNALLADMSVSDVHFLPHRAQLSPLGQQRLARLAELIRACGGQVRFSTDSEDTELVQRRLKQIRRFLGEAGVDTTGDVVVLDHPGGGGMMATEAVLIKLNEGTYKPKKDASGQRGDNAGTAPTGSDTPGGP